MGEYVKIFGWVTLGVDVILLVACCFCLYCNTVYLINYSYIKKDVSFRAWMWLISTAYALANFEALKRHIDTFIYKDGFRLTEEMVNSLLSDRGFMLFTGMCLIGLTLKYKTEWFE